MGFLLLKPEEIQDLVDMREAIEAVELGYADSHKFPVINAPRRRVHSPAGVRISNFPGGAHSVGVSGAAGRPVLLFLHGFPEGAFIWDELLLHFSRPENGGYHCVAPYLRGFGPSSSPAENHLKPTGTSSRRRPTRAARSSRSIRTAISSTMAPSITCGTNFFFVASSKISCGFRLPLINVANNKWTTRY